MENNEKLPDITDKLIDLELAKSDNANSKVMKYLPAVVFLASFYYSFLLALGLALGYLGSKVFAKYMLDQGKVDCIYIDCGKWKIHMHHWIMGALFLVIVWFIDYFYLPRFFVGVVCGIIAHDIYDYNDWHKVLVKNEDNTIK
jgi:multisubunit Na+/H+ antiporter MnhF subunit